MKKRLLALALAVGLCVTALPARAAEVGLSGERSEVPVTDSSGLPATKDPAAPAVPEGDAVARLAASDTLASGSCGINGVTWALSGDGVLQLSGTGKIPSYTSDTSTPWYSYRDRITSLQVENGVTSIGRNAFCGLSKLTTVSMADSVDDLQRDAFKGCSSLTEVTLSSQISIIPIYCFSGCSALTDLVLPERVTTLAQGAFQGCSGLKTVTVGSRLSTCAQSAFGGCSSLEGVYLSDLAAWCSIDFRSADANPLTQAHKLYVNGEAVTSLVIPDSVTAINKYAFSGWSELATVTIGSGLTTVNDNAFAGCTGINDVLYPGADQTGLTISSTGNAALLDAYWHYGFTPGSPLVNLAVVSENGTLQMPRRAYPGETVSIVPVPKAGYRLVTVTADKGLVTDALQYTVPSDEALEAVTLTAVFEPLYPDRVISDSGACGDRLTWVLYTDGLLLISGQGQMTSYAKVGDVPWHGSRSKITSVVIDEGVSSVSAYALAQCPALTGVTVGTDVASFGANAFAGCAALEGVYLSDLDAWYAISFANADANPLTQAHKLYVNGQAVTSLVIPDSVAAIGPYVFSGCTDLSDVFYTGPDQTGLDISSTGNAPLLDAYWHYGFTPGSPLVELTVAPSDQGTLRMPRQAYPGETVSITPLPGPGYRFKSVTADKGTVTGELPGELQYTVPSDGALEPITFTAVFDPLYPDRAISASGACGDELTGSYLTWILYTDGFMLISGDGLMADYKSAGAVPWHQYRSLITSIQIEDGVSSVGAYAFTQCPYLTSVTIPASVDAIGAGAFADCANLGRAEFLGGAPRLGDKAFYKNGRLPAPGQFCVYYHEGNGWESLISTPEGETAPTTWNDYYVDCVEAAASVTDFSTLDENNRNSQGIRFLLSPDSLTARVGDNSIEENNSGYYGMCDGVVTIPATVTDPDGKVYEVDNVGHNAFAGNKTVRKIILGEHVQGLTPSSFQDTSNLALVTPDEANRTYKEEDSVLYHIDKTILYVYPAKKEGAKFTVPEAVQTVVSNAFRSNPFLEEVIVPENVLSIGPEAFCNCRSLSKLTLPFLGSSASDAYPFARVFSEGSQGSTVPATLKEVVITKEELCKDAFAGCSGIQRITLPSCSTVPARSFYNCSGLISLRFADSELEYADGVLLLPKGVSAIGDSAFYGCTGLTSAAFAEGLESIGAQAFRRCSALTSVTMPLGLQTIGASAFSECDILEEAVIPDSVTTVGASAFFKCRSLPAIVIPDSVTTVGDQAFAECSGAKSVTIGRGLTKLGGAKVFYNCPKIQSFSVDKSNASFTSDRWGVLFNKDKSILLNYPASRLLPYYSVPRATDTVQSYAFQGHYYLKNLYIPADTSTFQKDAIERDTGTTYCVYQGTPADDYVIAQKFTPWYMDNRTPQAIEIKGLPDCAALPLGPDELDGLYLLVTYDNDLVLQMEDYTVSYGTPEPSGYQVATVSYQGLTTTFEVLRYDPQQHAPIYCGPLDPALPEDAVRLAALYQDGQLCATYTPLVINGKLLVRANKDYAQLTGKLLQLDKKTLAPLAESVQLPVPTIY